MDKNSQLIMVAVITAAHGIKGQVIVKPFTAQPSAIFNLPCIDKSGASIALTKIGKHKQGFICNVPNCHDRNEAESLAGMQIFCHTKDLPATNQDEYYIEQLRGLTVIDQDGAQIGIVNGLYNFGAGDIVEINFDNGTSEMLPFTKELFPEITATHIKFCAS